MNKKTFIIAEIGSNHNGNFELAKEMVKKAAKAGVNAVKFQMYKAETLVHPKMPPLPLAGKKYKSQYERFKELEFSSQQFVELAELAKKLGLEFVASAWDYEMVDLVDKLSNIFKIASGDLTNLPLVRYIAKKDKPIMLSTGFATLVEIKRVIEELPKDRLILLHCVGCYPCNIEDANLLTIPYLREKFKVPVGYSDHTIGTLAAKVAVALGACVIEKHFTLDKTQPIGDHRLSADPKDMKELVRDIRQIEKLIGKPRKGVIPAELKIKRLMRRSIFARVDIPKGVRITHDMLITLRPEDGISPLKIDEVVRKKALKDIEAFQIIKEKDLG